MENQNIFKRFFFSCGRHLKVFAIAIGFSTIVYGGIYLIMYLTGYI
ncbi:MAG: hypothetical protein HOH19_00480 [Kordiimonadaceae bacterium]|jgi:hypothetical protein|nr:hypothetical protein [Kordiimonadaceae bacterium]MBT6031024.1 hypothetical protein [Kordiimonadaceae bacterium]